MKVYNFGITYLGGQVDLPRLQTRLSPAYPGLRLELLRQHNVLRVPLDQGTIEADGATVPYSQACYQFENGFGSNVLEFELPAASFDAVLLQIQEVIGNLAVTPALIGYVKLTFGLENLGDLFATIKRQGGAKRIREEAGISLLTVGLDDFNIIINQTGCCWLVGPEPVGLPRSQWKDLSGGHGLLLASDTNRFWSPAYSDDLFHDLLLLLHREHSIDKYKQIALNWLDTVRKQLIQTEANLQKPNEELWAQDREDVESLDINYLLQSISFREYLADQEYLGVRSYGFGRTAAIDPQAWETITLFPRQRKLAEGTLTEVRQVIERMTRPLDFREFKMLKSGVEEVEARIMLLTVLLVILEIFAKIFEPGHWEVKGIMLGFLALIPAGYLLWERTRKGRIRRHGRRIYLENRRKEAEEKVRLCEQEIGQLMASTDISPEVLSTLLRLRQDDTAKFREKIAKYDQELNKLT